MEIKYNSEGLIPAIIQDTTTKTVLMLGYMNAEALSKTLETNKVTFFSRSKQRLWTKGEESGHFLTLNSIKNDCDNDSLLIQATAIITFALSSYIVVFNYPSPIAVNDKLRRD